MKKIIISLLLLTVLLTAAGCNRNDPGGDPPTDAPIDTADIIVDDRTPEGETDGRDNTQGGATPTAEPEGFCAVGAVDADSGRCAVLLGSGYSDSYAYAGVTPVSGLVYKYKLEGETITLTAAKSFPEMQDDKADWVFATNSAGGSIYYGGGYNSRDDSVFFLRFSATEWSVYRGRDVFYASTTITGGFLYTTDGSTIDCMMICGNCMSPAKLTPVTQVQTAVFDKNGVGATSGDYTLTDTAE